MQGGRGYLPGPPGQQQQQQQPQQQQFRPPMQQQQQQQGGSGQAMYGAPAQQGAPGGRGPGPQFASPQVLRAPFRTAIVA